MKLTKSQLQAQLNKVAKYSNLLREAEDKIIAHCFAVYHTDPGSVDFDGYIDSSGGCGMSEPMSAENFHQGMLWNMEKCGLLDKD